MISYEQLVAALVAAGIPQGAIHAFDDDYECPSPDWITGRLREDFESALFDSGITAREGFDCNKLAKLATTVSDLCWYKTGQSEAVLALGMLAASFHMLLVAVHTDGAGGLRVACYDPTPQVIPGNAVTNGSTMREVKVTPEEYASCSSCIFV